MDNNERLQENGRTEKDREIQLVLSDPAARGGVELGNVIVNMRRTRRVFAWVLVLCLTVGFCAPLLLYQFTKAPMTVSSIVTLRYETPVKVQKVDANGETIQVVPEDPEYETVKDLSAPDGTDLDLNQITSTYVLQTALNGMTLSQPITAGNLRSNIKIQTVLTEKSHKAKEALEGLATLKNADAYRNLSETEMEYEPYFVVSLSNGFADEGNEDALFKKELKNDELQQVLDRVLTVYNDYLVQTYADVRLPDDEFSLIDAEGQELLISTNQLKDGLKNLQDYCEQKTDKVRGYRSRETHKTLTDWTETVKTFRKVKAESLEAGLLGKGVTDNKDAVLNNYSYLLRNVQKESNKTSKAIEETGKTLAGYKNDDIYISMQESNEARTTKAATDYYNQLVLQQAENYDKAAGLTVSAAEYEERIKRLEITEATPAAEANREELTKAVAEAKNLYEQIRAHMEELFESPYYTIFETHTVPQGKELNFLAASAKRIILGVALGAVLAFGLWFLWSAMPEFTKDKEKQKTDEEAPETGKEAAGK